MITSNGRFLRRLSRGAGGTALVSFMLISFPALVAAAPAKPAKKLVNVADTRALAPGITRWIADLYNTSLWQFALVAVVLMALLGLTLGFLCDRLMGLLGINLGRMQHHE